MKWIIVIALLFLLTACSNNITGKATEINNCNISMKTFFVRGNSMQPMLQPEQELYLLEKYYLCNPVKKGELVAYDYKGTENDVIKIVKATDKDTIYLKDGKLIINGQPMVNSKNQTYTFQGNEIKMLSLYIEDNHIPKNSYLLFGDNIHSSKDSRNFGAVSKNNFRGRFIVSKS